jgi:1,4-alpha-glucan branching enzyme
LNFNVLNGYRHFANIGKIEIITCGATHGFLPLLAPNSKAVENQISIAVESHKRHFGVSPNGIWLPECAYFEGLDEVLAKYNIKFFFMDSHSLVYSRPLAKYGVFAPSYTKSSVAVFARDPESSKQVWSSKEGYPGDFDYRDFYKDIGYELDYDYISPYISPDGVRVFTGLKYYKVTGETDDKQVYIPSNAMSKTYSHAKNFHSNREQQFDYLSEHMDRTPMIVSPYDAELFGHWWFEGPDFLYNLFKEMDSQKTIQPLTPMEYLALYPKNQVVSPNPSSWGDKGYYDVWLNRGNDWIYRHLHFMANRLCELANQHRDTTDNILTKLLNQMVRELLLAQSSDWAFLMTTKTAVEYSTKRTKEHISNFNRLNEMIDNIDMQFLEWLEYKNSIFEWVDFRSYAN